MIIEGDDLVFSTGKEVYANNGIVGIDFDCNITHGYDGEIDSDELTKAEKIELADYAIAKWTKFRNKVNQ